MKITIKEYEHYNESEILNLYNSVGWCSYTSKSNMLKNAFEHSLKIFGAYAEDKLVGIIRSVGDGYSVLFIQDILILPEYQRKGIGKMLIKEMINAYPNVYQIELTTDNTEKTITFYKSCGFIKYDELNCVGFCKINY